jgi:hypothetical protein
VKLATQLREGLINENQRIYNAVWALDCAPELDAVAEPE